MLTGGGGGFLVGAAGTGIAFLSLEPLVSFEGPIVGNGAASIGDGS